MKIANKISFSFFITALILVCIVGPVIYIIEKQNLKNTIFEHLITTIHSRTHHIETFLETQKGAILQLSQSVILEDFLSANKQSPDYGEKFDRAIERLEETVKVCESIYEFFILNTNGKIIASSDRNKIGLDRSTDSYFLGVKKGVYVKDAYHSKTTGEESMAVSAPIIDSKTKKFLGVVVARVKFDMLNKITFDRTGLGKTGEIYLINKYGYMITPSRFIKDTFLKLRVDTENTRRSFEDIKGFGSKPHKYKPFVYKDYRGIKVLGVHDHIPKIQWVLLAEIGKKEALAPLLRIKITLIIMIFLIPIIAWLFGLFISRIVVAPIHKLRKATEIIGVGNLDYKVDIDAKDEIGQLSRAFNKMVEDLKRTSLSIAILNKEITERKKVEEALLASENKYRMLLENIPQKIFLKDRNLVYVSCNENYARDLKIKPDEIVGKTDFEFYPKELAEKYRADDKRLMESDKTENIEEKYVREGQEVIVHTVKTPVKDEKDNMVGILGIFWDITECKRAEEEIKSYQKKIEALIDSSKDLIFLKDKDFRYLIANKSHEKLFGIKIKDIIGKTDFDFMSKEVAEGCGKSDREVLETENPIEKEEVIDDRCFHVIKQKVVNEKRDIIGIAAVIRDITDHKKADRRLEETYQKLKETQEQLIQSGKMAAMGQLAAGISHELNQPLTGIKGFAQTILVDIEEGKLMREDVEKIIEQTDRMDRIIKNIRFFARRSEFKIEELDINQSIENALMLLEEQLRVHNIHLKKSLGEGLPKIKGDSNQLQQVFLNMITNARDAIDSLKNPSCGELIVESFLSGDKNNVEIIFQDTGCGISKENLENVFNPFFTTKSPDGGIGLGLSIAYRIIENHKGKIEVKSEVESKEGKGTTFKITLPISQFDA